MEHSTQLLPVVLISVLQEGAEVASHQLDVRPGPLGDKTCLGHDVMKGSCLYAREPLDTVISFKKVLRFRRGCCSVELFRGLGHHVLNVRVHGYLHLSLCAYTPESQHSHAPDRGSRP